jgi:glycosyltransferase involved in cell wall biosynthesis
VTGRSASSPLPVRNALAELRDVGCRLVAGQVGLTPVLVTVGIPTFRRGEMLAQAVRSVLAQDFDRPFEIVVTDNDPHSTGAEALLEAVPELRDRAFRYYVNAANVGGCHNVNRGIELARAPWVTILHDDDLLEPGFLSASFAELDADPSIDGLVGIKGIIDERAAPPPAMARPSAAVRARKLLRRGLDGVLYRGGSSRRIGVRKLFWGPLMGNIVGFVFRKSSAEALGGFDPREEPASDLWFYIRFAQRFHLRQLRTRVATCRLAVNDSLKPATIRAMFTQQRALHQTLADGPVPDWWRHLSPYLIARSRVELQDYWGVDIPADEIGRTLGMRLPGNRPYLIWPAKFLLRGF